MARVLTVTLNPALDLTVQPPALRLGEVNRSDNLQAHAAGKGSTSPRSWPISAIS